MRARCDERAWTPERANASGLPQIRTRHGGESIWEQPRPHADAAALPNGPFPTHRRFRPSDDIRQAKHVEHLERDPDARQRLSAGRLSPQYPPPERHPFRRQTRTTRLKVVCAQCSSSRPGYVQAKDHLAAVAPPRLAGNTLSATAPGIRRPGTWRPGGARGEDESLLHADPPFFLLFPNSARALRRLLIFSCRVLAARRSADMPGIYR
jgi:hypothetical protein